MSTHTLISFLLPAVLFFSACNTYHDAFNFDTPESQGNNVKHYLKDNSDQKPGRHRSIKISLSRGIQCFWKNSAGRIGWPFSSRLSNSFRRSTSLHEKDLDGSATTQEEIRNADVEKEMSSLTLEDTALLNQALNSNIGPFLPSRGRRDSLELLRSKEMRQAQKQKKKRRQQGRVYEQQVQIAGPVNMRPAIKVPPTGSFE